MKPLWGQQGTPGVDTWRRNGGPGGRARAELGFIPLGVSYKDWQLAKRRAAEDAFVITNRLKDRGMIDDIVDPRGEEALEFAIGIVRLRDAPIKDKLTAAKLVLEFTKQKPTTKQHTVLEGAEAFLDKLAEEEE